MVGLAAGSGDGACGAKADSRWVFAGAKGGGGGGKEVGDVGKRVGVGVGEEVRERAQGGRGR